MIRWMVRSAKRNTGRGYRLEKRVRVLVSASSRSLPVEAECRTVLEAYMQVIETDAKRIVDALNSGRADQTELGEMVTACHAIMLRNSGFEITFSKREKNKVAHLIARYSILHCYRLMGARFRFG
ncbi:hypothetical protein LINPERPRIM_LOCUS29182 [Linum perenne]